MEIYLVRHGIAEDGSRSGADKDRRLTEEGRKKTSKMAAVLRDRVRDLGVIFHSPYVRAVETAELFANEFREAPMREVAYLTPYDPPEKVLALLKESEHFRYVMLVGHNPYMGSLASLLLTGSAEPSILEFKKAGVAGIEWIGGRGKLTFFLSPKFI
ncbi:MAG: phosphohistidine phosphatase SixA [Bacteriovoracia bacterium]